jgi:hypothetical protein
MDKNTRRMLWLGKFAFPKVNTKITKLLFAPPDYRRYYMPILYPLMIRDFNETATYSEPKRTEIELNKWAYNGKRRRAIIRFGYYEEDDVLLVSKEAFVYQERHKVSGDSSWWFLDPAQIEQ